MTSPAQVAVLGAGSWGTALAILLCQNIPKVTMWGRDPDHIDAISRSGRNDRYLPDIPLPENLSVTSDLTTLCGEFKDFLIVVPSKAFRTTLENLRQVVADENPGLTLVSATKGFDPDTSGLLSDLVEEKFGDSATFAVISGPSFARETAMGMPTAFTLASSNQHDAQKISSWFQTPTTRVYFSEDTVGVQLGGAIKNVMAIASGISDGLGYGANARAALITRGLSELRRLGVALGGNPDTFMGLTGVGDLILTCTDDQSRNRRFGLGIGKGLTTEQVLADIDQEVEGVNTVNELYKLANKFGIEMPITEQIFKILNEGEKPAEAVQKLLSRAQASES